MTARTFDLGESEHCKTGCSRLLVLGACTEASEEVPPATAASGTLAMPRATLEPAKHMS